MFIHIFHLHVSTLPSDPKCCREAYWWGRRGRGGRVKAKSFLKFNKEKKQNNMINSVMEMSPAASQQRHACFLTIIISLFFSD